MENWTFKSIETGAYEPEKGARQLHATRDRTNEGCGGFAYVFGCVSTALLLVFVVGWFVWSSPPARVAAAEATAASATIEAGSDCNCPAGEGWCSFAQCAPCCHSQCTTSENERAQCEAGTLS